jgi:DNA-directed RNA polymerase subunit RPC12/RpoP
MLGKKNVKCPRCKKPIPYETLKARNGKCPYCDYVIVGNLSKFLDKMKS